MSTFDTPINWNNYNAIAANLYQRFGDEFDESKIQSVRLNDLREWVLEIRNFAGTKEDSNQAHLEMIQNSWLKEWRTHNNDTPHVKM